MSARPRCYVASPLGFSEAGRHYYANVYLPALRAIVEPVDPWAVVTEAEIAEATSSGREHELAAEIGRRNQDELRSCRLLVALLDGQEIDAGVAAEVGFAAALGLRCLGLRTDHRQTGERGATINLQVESFIALSGGRIATSLEALLELLEETVAGGLPAADLPPRRTHGGDDSAT